MPFWFLKHGKFKVVFGIIANFLIKCYYIPLLAGFFQKYVLRHVCGCLGTGKNGSIKRGFLMPGTAQIF